MRKLVTIFIMLLIICGIMDQLGSPPNDVTRLPNKGTDVVNIAKFATVNTATGTFADAAINGKPLEKALVDNARNNLGTQTQSYLAKLIGDGRLRGNISHTEQLALHAAAGATGAFIKNTDPWSSMLAAPTAEAAAELAFTQGFKPEASANIGKITGATSGLLTNDVTSASESATTAIDNNFLPMAAQVVRSCAMNPACASLVRDGMAVATAAAMTIYKSTNPNTEGFDIVNVKNKLPGFTPETSEASVVTTPIHEEGVKTFVTPIYEQDQSEYLEGFTAAPDWLKNFGAVLLSERPDTVEKIAGHYPRNSKYAGKTFPIDKLPSEIRGKYPDSVKFNEKGFPDFTPYAIKSVKLDNLKGDNLYDSKMANKSAGLSNTPKDYVWHHVEDGKTMQLIPRELHVSIRHTGGCAVIKNKIICE